MFVLLPGKLEKLGKSEKILSLNSKQKSLCQLATIQLFVKKTKGNSKEMTEARLDLML